MLGLTLLLLLLMGLLLLLLDLNVLSIVTFLHLLCLGHRSLLSRSFFLLCLIDQG
jgi:hypothetical protein